MAAVARIVLRLRTHRRLFVDDIFLLLACVFLTATTIILYEASSEIYLNPNDWMLLQPDVLHRRLARYQRLFFSFIPLSWAVIFAVKFSFLSFFRILVNRLRYMIIYWKTVVVVTVICFCFCASEAVLECPHFGADSSKSVWPWELTETYFYIDAIVKCGFDKGLANALRVTTAAICLDIITDLMSSVSPSLIDP